MNEKPAGISGTGEWRNPVINLFWFSFLGVAQRAVYLLLLPVYLKYLTPGDYGILALVTLFSTVAVVVANLRLDAAMRTFYFDFGDDDALHGYLTQIFSASFIMVASFLSVMLLIGPFLYSLIFTHAAVRFYPLGALSLATACITLCLSPYLIYLRNRLMLKEYVLLELLLIVGTIGLQLFLLAWQHMGLLGVLLGALIPAAVALIYLLGRHPELVTLRLRRASLLPSLRFSLPLVAFAFLFVLERQLDRLVIERYLSLDTVGIYAVLASLLGLVVILFNALDNALRPFLFRSLKERGPGAGAADEHYFTLYLFVGLLALSTAILLGSNLHLATDDSRYLSVQPYFALASTALLPLVFIRYYALLYLYHKQSTSLTLWTLLRTIVTLILLIWWVPKYEIRGALVAILVSQFVNASIFAVQMQRSARLDIKRVLLPIVGFLAVVWSLFHALAEVDIGLFGLTQFVCILGLLLALIKGRIGPLMDELRQATAPGIRSGGTECR